MFPEETHVKVVKRLDDMEAEMYGLYRRMENLRLELQRQWRVLPSGERWNERSQVASEFSSPPTHQPASEGGHE